MIAAVVYLIGCGLCVVAAVLCAVLRLNAAAGFFVVAAVFAALASTLVSVLGAVTS